MDVRTKAGKDRRLAAKIQELREKAAQSSRLDVDTIVAQIGILLHFPGEERHSKYIIFNAKRNEPQYEQLLTAIGEVLAHGHSQLQHFLLAYLDCENNSYPQFWRGLAANRVLKEVYFQDIDFPNELNVAPFFTNPALESLDTTDSTFSQATFDSLCQGIRSSHIKELKIGHHNYAGGVSWSSLWPALEHGTSRLESLNVRFAEDTPRGIENGFESFLTNNATIQCLRLSGITRGRDDLPFLQALGRALAVNSAVRVLTLGFSSALGNPAIDERRIQTVFAEGLGHNMMVNRLVIWVNGSLETVNAVANGLERMMRSRASAATIDGHDQEESLPVLKELAVHCTNVFHQADYGAGVVRDVFFDRLSRSDVIRVEKVVFSLPRGEPLLSSKVYDFIRSTRATKSLELNDYSHLPNDNTLIDLADAMEANKSISELQVGRVVVDTTTNLLSSPNKYRIRCQCRRNQIQVHTLRKPENLSLLPLALARLLPLDDRPTDDEERRIIEARQLVGRTIVFEMLQDIPALFTV